MSFMRRELKEGLLSKLANDEMEQIFPRVAEECDLGYGTDFKDSLHKYLPVLTSALGLACARVGLLVMSYGSYLKTDSNLLTDGATLLALLVFGCLALFLLPKERRFDKKTVHAMFCACVGCEALCIAASLGLHLAGCVYGLHVLVMSALCCVFASGSMFFWLRRARGASTATATLLVFLALVISELLLLPLAYLPGLIAHPIALVLVLLQFVLVRRARKQPFLEKLSSATQRSDFFGFTKGVIADPRFLMATAAGLGCLAAVCGFLRGYQGGSSITFTFGTRLAYAVVTVGTGVAIATMVLQGRQRVMTVGIFVVLQVFACLALILYAAFPLNLEYGAVFATAMNALMVAFTWYICIAFMSAGWRDPYYYACSGWIVWLGMRSSARMALSFAPNLCSNSSLLVAVLGAAVLISTQVVFMLFLSVAHVKKRGETPSETLSQESPIVRLMGLDMEAGSSAYTRKESMEHSVKELGKQFLLSEREQEVLALYALGYTQKRVAEELFISQGTVHVHIKRIYTKTNMHSRQEILDYMSTYAL